MVTVQWWSNLGWHGASLRKTGRYARCHCVAVWCSSGIRDWRWQKASATNYSTQYADLRDT